MTVTIKIRDCHLCITGPEAVNCVSFLYLSLSLSFFSFFTFLNFFAFPSPFFPWHNLPPQYACRPRQLPPSALSFYISRALSFFEFSLTYENTSLLARGFLRRANICEKGLSLWTRLPRNAYDATRHYSSSFATFSAAA